MSKYKSILDLLHTFNNKIFTHRGERVHVRLFDDLYLSADMSDTISMHMMYRDVETDIINKEKILIDRNLFERDLEEASRIISEALQMFIKRIDDTLDNYQFNFDEIEI